MQSLTGFLHMRKGAVLNALFPLHSLPPRALTSTLTTRNGASAKRKVSPLNTATWKTGTCSDALGPAGGAKPSFQRQLQCTRGSGKGRKTNQFPTSLHFPTPASQPCGDGASRTFKKKCMQVLKVTMGWRSGTGRIVFCLSLFCL